MQFTSQFPPVCLLGSKNLPQIYPDRAPILRIRLSLPPLSMVLSGHPLSRRITPYKRRSMARSVHKLGFVTSSARPVELDASLYREVFTHSKEAIAIISPEGYYLEQNGAHYNLLGYTDDELEGQTPAIHMGEE